MVVYLDGVMGLNFLVDWMLLLGVNRLSGHPTSAGRTAAGAALGGGYAGMCLVPGFGFLSSGLWRGVSLGLITLTAFGTGRSAFRRGVLFVFLSMALGGLVVSFDFGNFGGIAVSSGLLFLLCRMGFQGKLGRVLVPVSIVCRGRKAELLALRDTGNTLKDPVTGEAVLIVGPEVAFALLGIDGQALKDPAALTETYGGLRLIPYHGVGAARGLLPAVVCEEVRIGKSGGRGIVAFAPEPFPDGEYQALTGG